MPNVPYIVSTDWLADRLEDPRLRLIDATTFLKAPEESGPYEVWSGKDAYAQEHLPGAVYADVLGAFSDPDAKFGLTVPPREQFLESVGPLGVTEGTYVVVYDRGAQVNSEVVASDWASRFAWQLRFEGFEDVAVLDGGLPKWKKEGRPLTAEPGSYPGGQFPGERRDELIVGRDEVEAAIDDENTVLINSLSKADFDGKTNVYARSGHIPSSEHVFFGDHSDPDTLELLDDETLREHFAKVGALDPDKKVITYCGGGIAATWNAVLLNKLGQHQVAVYDGSMSEWASDPDLPLHTTEP